jgi:hypothetical protein
VYPQTPFSGLAPADAKGGRPTAAGRGGHAGRPAVWPAGLTRLGVTGVLAAALAVGAVACGGSSPGASGSASAAASAPAAGAAGSTGLAARIYRYLNGVPGQKKAAFVHCMRSNGEPSFPSALTLSALQSAGITLRSAQFRGAFLSCKSTLAK